MLALISIFLDLAGYLAVVFCKRLRKGSGF